MDSHFQRTITMVAMVCRCGTNYDATQADLNRGWGRSCDKSCAAKRRDFGGKAAKRLDGKPLKMTQSFKGAKRKTPDKRVQTPYNKQNYLGSGVDRDTFMYYKDQYGGMPQFNRKGEYEGFCGTDPDHDCNKE